jgi:hypothetical protein
LEINRGQSRLDRIEDVMGKILRWALALPIAILVGYLAYLMTLMIFTLPLRLFRLDTTIGGRAFLEITSNGVLGSLTSAIAFHIIPSQKKIIVAVGLWLLLFAFILYAGWAVHKVGDGWGYVGLVALMVSSSLQLLFSLAEEGLRKVYDKI